MPRWVHTVALAARWQRSIAVASHQHTAACGVIAGRLGRELMPARRASSRADPAADRLLMVCGPRPAIAHAARISDAPVKSAHSRNHRTELYSGRLPRPVD